MNETEKLQEVFQNTAGMLGENQPHDLQRMQNSARTVVKSQAAFLEAAREAGVCPSSKLVAAEPLTAEGLVKLTKTIEGLVQGHYQKRSEWHDMRDVNGYLSTIFSKPEVNRQALAKALRAEEVELVTISYNTIYIDAAKAVSSDPKRADKVAKIVESRAQDQHLLAAALGSLLSKHSPTLKERIEGRDPTQVTLNDLDDKGFTVMVWAELLLDVAHVRDNVKELLEIFAYPSTFASRFHGNILTFTKSLDADLDAFEARNGLITKRQISQLLTLQVLNDSMEASIKSFRKEVVYNVHHGCTKEFHSFKLMTERYGHVLAAAISFQKTHYGETFAKMPVERDEWRRRCAKLELVCNFVSNDQMPPCDLCGGRHPLTSGCDVTVNLKRVCDESSTVLRGMDELMAGIAKIQAELVKGKTCVEVQEKIEKMLTDGGAMLTRFNKAMEPIKKKWKQNARLVPTPKDMTNVATKSKEEVARIAAMTIAQKLKDAGVPTDLCWRWYTTGECKWRDVCRHKHPEQYRGQAEKPDEEQVDHGNGAVAEKDGPVPGTKCLNCKEEPQYREKGKVYPYCGITCAAEAGALGEPKQETKLSNNAMIEEEDSAWRGSDYMAMAGISHVEMMQQAHSLGFVAVSGPEHVEDEGSMYPPGMVELLQSMGFIMEQLVKA